MKYVCNECGGTNIQRRVWVDANTDKINSDCSDGDSADNWCEDCESHVDFDVIND